MNLTKIAIERPVLILMLMLAAILAGVVGYKSMRLEENPDVSFGVVTVTSIYPGAGPEEVNNLITRKIEDAVNGVNGIDELKGSSLEGVSSVVIQFKLGTDMQTALNEVRNKVDSVTKDLPSEVEKPTVEKLDTGSEAVIFLAVKSKNFSNRQLRDLAKRELKDRIGQINGVSTVAVSGGEEREIQVRLKKDALIAYGVGIADVQRAIQNATLNIPSGRIVQGNQEFNLRMLGDVKRVQDVQELYLTISDGKGPTGTTKTVRLGDIADVVDGNVERKELSRLNGEEAVILAIQKSREGNAVEISHALREPRPLPNNPSVKMSLLQQLEKQYGVNFIVSLDSSTRIEESIEDLNFAIIFGIILVTAVVWLFLHNLRGTLIVGIAIPICLFGTLAALWALGFTINNMTMLALSLAIGVLVDDAIVIIENIYRHLRAGEEPEEAALNGRTELGLAAIAITLADVVVFLPIGFMGGVSGQFLKALGIGYVICVIFSLFVSFTVTPMLAARWYKKGEDLEHPTGKFAQWFERGFHKLADAYGRGVKKALAHRWYVFAFGFAILWGVFMFIGGSFIKVGPGGYGEGVRTAFFNTKEVMIFAMIIGAIVFAVNWVRGKFRPQYFIYAALFAMIFPLGGVGGFLYRNGYKNDDVFKFGFFPTSDTGRLSVTVDLPPGTSLAKTKQVVDQIEKKVLADPLVEFAVTTIGNRGGGFSALQRGSNIAEIVVTLREKHSLMDSLNPFAKKHENQRTVTSEYAAGQLSLTIGRVPGARISVSQKSNFGVGGAIQLSFQSNDRELLTKTTIRIRDELAKGVIPGVVNPDLSSKPGKPELRAIPDRAKLANLDLSAAQIGSAMRVMYEGDDQSKLRIKGEEYDIRVMLDLEDRNNADIVSQVPVAFKDNKPIYLGDVASIESGVNFDRIDRRTRMEEVVVNADLLNGFSFGPVNANIEKWMTDNKIVPAGVEYKKAGQAQVQARESGYLFGALFTGLILVYMLLAVLYDNLLYPFIIQLAQPQAMVGALLALIITDKGLNVVGFIGVIALVGLVGKNAILLVDYANTLRKRGMEKHEALIESGKTRLRPIIMTTSALLVGMLPVAMAIGRGSEFRETIGITIIGGTLLSTMLTLFVIPCSYSIFDQLSQSLANFLKRFKKNQPEESTETA